MSREEQHAWIAHQLFIFETQLASVTVACKRANCGATAYQLGLVSNALSGTWAEFKEDVARWDRSKKMGLQE